MTIKPGIFDTLQVRPGDPQFKKNPSRPTDPSPAHSGRRHHLSHAGARPASRGPRGHDGLLSDQGMGGACGDGRKPAREQVDTRQVRLPGELQRRVDAGHAENGGFRAAVAQTGHHCADAVGGDWGILYSAQVCLDL